MEYQLSLINRSRQLPKLIARDKVKPLQPLIYPLLKSLCNKLLIQHLSRMPITMTSALKACWLLLARSGRMKWKESSLWDWMVTREERNLETTVSFNQATLKSKVTSFSSSMEMLWRFSTTLSSRSQWYKFHSSTSGLITSSVLLTFPSSRDSWILNASCSRTTTSIASFKFQSWRHCPLWPAYPSKTMKSQAPFFLELSLYTGSLMSTKSTAKRSQSPTSTRQDSSFSTLTRFCLHQLFSRLKYRRSLTVMKVRRIAHRL